MFEAAEIEHDVDKKAWKSQEAALREGLLAAQVDLARAADVPLLILVDGVEASGRSETVNVLLEWFDPRRVAVHAFDGPTEDERERPPMWRYWRALPPKGRIGIFFGAWHTDALRAAGDDVGRLDRSIHDIVRFERMLADDGVLLLKFWFHLTKEQQGHRLRELASDPATAWRVTDRQTDAHARYDDALPVAERLVRETSTGSAPWFVVPGANARYRQLLVGRTVLASLRERLDRPRPPPIADTPALPEPVDDVNVLTQLDLTARLDEAAYDEALPTEQGRLARATRHKRFRKSGLVAVFEGVDAAGKGGAIRRVAHALDARSYSGVSVAAPTEEERDQPYLWRFWRHLPRRGRVVLFDRSWYGRVLVERVEGYCTESDWMRAYAEINEFEAQLVEHGYALCKFWLQISPDEQLRRFREREATAWKRFKITEEDWRNREKWAAYQRAVCDMIDRTSTAIAPWTVVAAEDKRWARVAVLRTLADAAEAAISKD